MANSKQVKILRKGAATWNDWRLEHPGRPALSGAKLSEDNLRAADLGGAELA